MSKVTKVRKREGDISEFDPKKITAAIQKAFDAVSTKGDIKKITEKVVDTINQRFEKKIPTVEDVQDIVEKVLIKEGYAKVAKAYILYRQKRAEIRKAKKTLGVKDELKLPLNSIIVLAKRYLKRDKNRNIIESTSELFRRVAKALASVESKYGKSKEEVKKLEEEFYQMMTNFEFLPNSPTLMNAGIEDGLNLSACFVIPIGDSIEEIFDALKTMALVQKAGGGCIESGSRVFTTHCGVERIENLYEELSKGKEGIRLKNKEFVDVSREDVKTPSFDKDTGEVRFKKVSKIWKYQIPKEKTVKVEGIGRFEATVSEWHPFFVYENGIVRSKRADEIKKDDLILLPNKSIKKRWPFKAYRKIEGIELDEKLAWLAGLFLSDGSIDDDSPAELRIRIFNSDKKVIQKTLRILKEITGVSYTPQEDDRSKETVYRIAVYDRSLTKAIRKMNQGRIRRKELDVRIPEEIFKSPISVIGAFLAGLTDGDGHVQLNKRQIEYSMSSKDFICDLSALLYLLGIRSRFRERKDKRDENWGKMYEVAISGYENFKELAGLLGEHLTIEEKKRRIGEHLKNQHSSTTCPLSFDQFRSFLEEIGINVTCRRFWKKSIKIGGRKFFLGRWRGTNRISRIRVTSLINELLRNYKGKLSEKSIKELRRLGNILPSLTKVKKVKRCVSEKTFYDLTVEDTNNYFSGKKGLAIIHNTGYSFSRLRPEGDVVKSTGGVASGPISFMKVFNAATEQIKQGGKRRGANMGVLRVDHPDILDFVSVKEREGVLRNFNISVAVTDNFMKAVENDEKYELVNPRTKKPVRKIKARVVWDLMVSMAWRNGEPGILFLDTINKHNPTPKVGKIEATNPCAEAPLLPYESCNLGSINLSKMVKNGEVNWNKLKKTVRLAVQFLDNVIDANKYPISEIEKMTKANRKIGLGIMGFADMLIKLGIPYDSGKAIKIAEKVMKFISEEGRKRSVELGREKGSFPNFDKSIWADKYETMRNATITTIAPTGTISIIAGCSQGIEPLFSIAYVRHVAETIGRNLTYINPLFEKIAIKKEFYSEELIKKISGSTSIQHIKEIPESVRRLFKTAHDISPKWHVRIQATFQRYTDQAASKTINFPENATPLDVEKAFWLAYRLGCKGLTVYRYGSRRKEVLTAVRKISETIPERWRKCEACGL